LNVRIGVDFFLKKKRCRIL